MNIDYPIDGSIVISTVHNGRRVSMKYFGYSLEEARDLFNQHLREQ